MSQKQAIRSIERRLKSLLKVQEASLDYTESSETKPFEERADWRVLYLLGCDAKRSLERIQYARRNLEPLLALEREGLGGVVYIEDERPYIRLGNLDAVRKARRALGRLTHDKDKRSALSETEVAITLRPEKYPWILLEYAIPYKGDGKCRIVRREYASYALVCDAA